MNRLVILAAIAVLSGCATAGNKFDIAAVDHLQPGVSTIQDATTLLGPYQSQSVNSKGFHVYGWAYARVNGFSGRSESQAVTLVFGPDGKLERKGSTKQDGKSY